MRKFKHHGKLMGKGAIRFFLIALLLGAGTSMAADEPDSTVPVSPADNPASTVTETPPVNPAENPGSPPASNAGDTSANSGAEPDVKDFAETAAIPNLFRGKYFGGKFGINNSTAIGTTSAPSASTLAYGLQGGYLQAGYNWDLHFIIAGIGAYFDWNNYTLHSNGIAYSSRALGVDAKVGIPMDEWLPYIKLGYGYNSGAQEITLHTVVQKRPNIAAGFEYYFAPRWSVIAEYKTNRFSNRDGSITINNKIFSFGFNYYFDMPLKEKKVEVAPEPDLPIPEPVLAPEALPDAPPPP